MNTKTPLNYIHMNTDVTNLSEWFAIISILSAGIVGAVTLLIKQSRSNDKIKTNTDAIDKLEKRDEVRQLANEKRDEDLKNLATEQLSMIKLLDQRLKVIESKEPMFEKIQADITTMIREEGRNSEMLLNMKEGISSLTQSIPRIHQRIDDLKK